MKLENITKKFLCFGLVYIFNFTILAKNQNITIKQISEFSLMGVDYKTYTNKDLNGLNGTLLVFLSNHCKFSQTFQQFLIHSNRKWKNQGIKLIAISPNHEKAVLPDEMAFSEVGDSFEEMVLRSQTQNYNFAYIYDGKNQIITKSIETKITPSAYLFDSQGELVYSGRIGDQEMPNDYEKSELHQNIVKLINKEKVEYNRTKIHGTAIKFKKDIRFAEKLAKRYAEETIRLNYADERKLNFFIEQETNYPRFFYVWSLENNPDVTRENLIKISTVYKIFRKRGIKVFTVCICKPEDQSKVLEILKQTQLSSLNFYTGGTEVSKLVTLRSQEGKRITPFCRIIQGDNSLAYGKNDLLDIKVLKREFLYTLNKKGK
ncbi:MAG: redoxin domain-containing protein [Opitutales bacterium]